MHHVTVRSDDPTESETLADRLRAWGPAIGWAIVLFMLSALPQMGRPPSFPLSDKVGHFVLYAVLGATLAWGWSRSPRYVPHLVVLLVGAVYGVTDEWHQMYVPGRMPDLADWVADVLGLMAGYGATLQMVERTNGNVEAEEAT